MFDERNFIFSIATASPPLPEITFINLKNQNQKVWAKLCNDYPFSEGVLVLMEIININSKNLRFLSSYSLSRYAFIFFIFFLIGILKGI